jgi:benzoate-CoA ligase family protein
MDTDAPSLQIPEQFNAADYFIDRHITEGRSENIAILCAERTVTYGELFEAVNRVGNLLLRRETHKGERIALLLPDIPEFAESFFGAIKIGAVPVPMNTFLPSADYEYLLNDMEAQILITTSDLAKKITEIPSKRLLFLRDVITVDGWEDSIAKASPILEAAATGKDDVAFWLYTSGSTGKPKACVHLQHDMLVCYERYAKPIIKIQEKDRCFSVGKLFFAYGLGNSLYYPLGAGATAILLPEPAKSTAIFETIRTYKPTLFFSIPSQYRDLLEKAEQYNFSKDDMASVRFCVSAGEVLPMTLFSTFKEKFGHEVLDSIGSTEALQAFITSRPNAVRPGSSGQIIPGYRAKIVDDAGNPVPCGEIGNLMIESDAVCAYYWNQPEKTAAAIQGSWLRTGDVYSEDNDGYFWYIGRADDMFKVNGLWVSPIEIEQAIAQHPAVAEVAVVGKRDDNGLTKPSAYVVLRAGANSSTAVARDENALAEIKKGIEDIASDTLSAYKRPQWITFVATLPRTGTGKLQRFLVREAPHNREPYK